MNIADILMESVRVGASDVIISAGAPVTYHVHGVLLISELAVQRLTSQESESLTYQMLRDEHRKTFETTGELDLSFHLKDVSRFRVSVYRQRGTVASVLRRIPLRIPGTAEVGITDRMLAQILGMPNGLILITGPTGAGKSTTVASILEHVNRKGVEPLHIITIEDPIEFLLESDRCVIDQREVGEDTRSYAIGLRSALRQMPHIVFVGEMRDRETIEVALTAAETGNLVISTLSTQSAAKTVNRIIDIFPIEDQSEIRARLALTLRMAVAQVLVRREDGLGRVCAREIMLVNSPIANLIREGKVHMLNNAITSGAAEGMNLLDDALLRLYEEGAISKSHALSWMDDPVKARALAAGREKAFR